MTIELIKADELRLVAGGPGKQGRIGVIYQVATTGELYRWDGQKHSPVSGDGARRPNRCTYGPRRLVTAGTLVASPGATFMPMIPCRQRGRLTATQAYFSVGGTYKIIVLRRSGERYNEVWKSPTLTAVVGLVTYDVEAAGVVNVEPGDYVGFWTGTARAMYRTSPQTGSAYLSVMAETGAQNNALNCTTTPLDFQFNYAVEGDFVGLPAVISQTFAGSAVPHRWKHNGTAWTYSAAGASPGATGLANAIEFRFALTQISKFTLTARVILQEANSRAVVFSNNNVQSAYGSMIELRADTGELVVYKAYTVGSEGTEHAALATGIVFAPGDTAEITVAKNWRTKSYTVRNARTGAAFSTTVDDEDGKATEYLATGGWYGCLAVAALQGAITLERVDIDIDRQPDLLVYGDSISEGSGVSHSKHTWPRLLARSRRWEVQVHAQGGATTQLNGLRAVAELEYLSPRIVSPALGTNDTALAAWQQRMEMIVDYWSGMATVVGTTTPAEAADTLPEASFNPALLRIVPCARFDSALTTPSTGLGANRNALLYHDTLHPNEAGHAAMAEAWDLATPIT